MTAEQVRDELALLGQEDAQVTRTGKGFLDIRMSKLDLRDVQPPPTAGPTAGPTASPGASGATPAPTASAAPTATPATATPAPSASPSPTEASVRAATSIPTQGEIGAIAKGLQLKFGPIAEQAKLSSIGAVVSADLINQAFLLILVGSGGILGWITLRFRDVKFGVTALVALLHDVIVVVGIFAVLGTFFGVEIDALFVTAMLTVIGFSVHDTIVVFDRIRENRARHAGEPFADGREPLDPADLRPVDHDELHGGADPRDPDPVRRLGDAGVRPGAADRDHLRDVFLDLQRRAAPGRVAGYEDRRRGRLASPGKSRRATA